MFLLLLLLLLALLYNISHQHDHCTIRVCTWHNHQENISWNPIKQVVSLAYMLASWLTNQFANPHYCRQHQFSHWVVQIPMVEFAQLFIEYSQSEGILDPVSFFCRPSTHTIDMTNFLHSAANAVCDSYFYCLLLFMFGNHNG